MIGVNSCPRLELVRTRPEILPRAKNQLWGVLVSSINSGHINISIPANRPGICTLSRRPWIDSIYPVPAFGTRNTCNRVGRLDLGGEKLGLFEENSDYLMETWGAKILFA